MAHQVEGYLRPWWEVGPREGDSDDVLAQKRQQLAELQKQWRYGVDNFALPGMKQEVAQAYAAVEAGQKTREQVDKETEQLRAIILGMECWSNSANGHYLEDIPFILAGQGGGAFETGRIVDARGRSNNDLLVSVQRACGINSDVFGLQDLCEGPIV